MNKIFSEKYVAAISILWVVFMACLVILKRSTLGELGLNEIGDALAGAFAPLGFFWLVAGFYQQGKGLDLNSAALRLQVQELKQSTIALKQQTKELNATAEGQKQLIKIADQELQHKRFNAEPNFQFRIAKLNFYSEQVPTDVDDEGIPIDYIDEDLVRFDLVFKNVGPNARRVDLKNQNGSQIYYAHEIEQKEISKNIDISDQDFLSLMKGQTIYRDFMLSYCSIYGDKYLKSVTCAIDMVPDQDGEHLISNLSYKDLEVIS